MAPGVVMVNSRLLIPPAESAWAQSSKQSALSARMRAMIFPALRRARISGLFMKWSRRRKIKSQRLSAGSDCHRMITTVDDELFASDERAGIPRQQQSGAHQFARLTESFHRRVCQDGGNAI